MADAEQMKKVVPFITCEITFGQNVCELMFGINVSNLNFRIKITVRSLTHSELIPPGPKNRVRIMYTTEKKKRSDSEPSNKNGGIIRPRSFFFFRNILG